MAGVLLIGRILDTDVVLHWSQSLAYVRHSKAMNIKIFTVLDLPAAFRSLDSQRSNESSNSQKLSRKKIISYNARNKEVFSPVLV